MTVLRLNLSASLFIRDLKFFQPLYTGNDHAKPTKSKDHERGYEQVALQGTDPTQNKPETRQPSAADHPRGVHSSHFQYLRKQEKNRGPALQQHVTQHTNETNQLSRFIRVNSNFNIAHYPIPSLRT